MNTVYSMKSFLLAVPQIHCLYLYIFCKFILIGYFIDFYFFSFFLQEDVDPIPSDIPTDSTLHNLRTFAKRLYDDDIEIYMKSYSISLIYIYFTHICVIVI